MGIHFTKGFQDNTENYETGAKKNKENLSKWKNITVQGLKTMWLRQHHSLQWPTDTLRIPTAFYTEAGKLTLKFTWNYKGTQITKKEKFKFDQNGTKIVWNWHDKCLNQWNRIERSEINPYIYGQLIFNKNAKTIQWGKEFLQQKVLEQLESHVQQNDGWPLLHTIYKN